MSRARLARCLPFSHTPGAPNNTRTIMAKGNNAHKKEVKKPKKEKPKPLPTGRKTHG